MKDLILRTISQESIFQRYAGIDPFTKKRGKFSSPLRSDKTPSCSFYRNTYSGKLYMRDWSTDKMYDCFSFVQEKYNVTFAVALEMIAKDFGITKANGDLKITVPSVQVSLSAVEKREAWNGITYKLNKEFEEHELQYWAQYGITYRTLKTFNVYSVKALYIDGRKIRSSSSNDPCFCYDYKNSNKFYSPFNKLKWLGSAKESDIIGADQLSESTNVLVLTKSQKDVMCLYEYGYKAISLQGEGYRLKTGVKNQILEIIQQFSVKELVVLYDNDKAGIKGTVKILDELNSMISENELGIGLSYFFVEEEYKDVSEAVRSIILKKYQDEQYRIKSYIDSKFNNRTTIVNGIKSSI